LELRLPWAVLKRRPQLAAAIFGQEADPASLGSHACQSVLFLCERNILSLAAFAEASARPSGFVRGLDRGGRCRLFVAGGEFGPDCVSAIFFRVKDGYVKDLVVISFSFSVLLVKLCPPP
jgi:hypothetical protein